MAIRFSAEMKIESKDYKIRAPKVSFNFHFKTEMGKDILGISILTSKFEIEKL